MDCVQTINHRTYQGPFWVDIDSPHVILQTKEVVFEERENIVVSRHCDEPLKRAKKQSSFKVLGWIAIPTSWVSNDNFYSILWFFFELQQLLLQTRFRDP